MELEMTRTAFAALTVLAACTFEATSQEANTLDATDTLLLATGQPVQAQSLNTFFNQATHSGSIPGLSVAIINEWSVVYSASSGVESLETRKPVSTQTIFEGASLSKPLFGAFVVQLAEEGVIDLDEPLANIYPHPDLTDDERANGLTARLVLTHQTGLPNWRSHLPDGKLAITFPPGTRLGYSGEGYEYLADVLMHNLKIGDDEFDDLFASWLTDPLDVDATTFVQDSHTLERKADGHRNGEQVEGDVDYRIAEFGAAHSIHTNALSYAEALVGLFDDRILSPTARAEFFRPQGVSIPDDNPQVAFGLSDWALGFSVYDTPIGQFFVHGGNNRGYTNFAAINPSTGWGFVVLTNEDQADEFLQSVAAVLMGVSSL